MNQKLKSCLQLTSSKFSNILLILNIGMLGSMHVANAELTVTEKDPESSIVNQYEDYKTSDFDAQTVSNFVDQLNERVEQNPKDALAWQILAKLYYDYGDLDYAVYSASEAIDLGVEDNELYAILLTGSSSIVAGQIESGYAEQIKDESFIKQYQGSLSKIYGTIHGFNYNEALPKSVVRKRYSKAVKKYKPKKRVSRYKRTTVKPRPKRNVAPKQRSRPVTRPKPQAPKKTKPPVDPFKILR